MQTQQTKKPSDRAIPTAVGAIAGFIFGAGGGLAGALIFSAIVGGLLFWVSGLKPRPKPHIPAAGPYTPTPASIVRPADNTPSGQTAHSQKRLDDVWGVLDEALLDGTITEAAYDAMTAIARRRILEDQPAESETAVERFVAGTPPRPAPPTDEPPQERVREARRIQITPPTDPVPATPRPLPPPVRVEPSRIAAQVRRIWRTLISDFALHGLAYAGVLLVFVATLGFVIFAFSGVQSALRPVAEAVIPLMLFSAARFLRNRGAPFVSRSLMLLAGAVTPIVVFAAFQDGAGFPPDVEGAPLLILLTAMSLGLAFAYARVSVGDPTSPLRFLVGPLAWVAVGVIGVAFHSEPSAAQMSLVVLAIAGTALLARRQTTHTLSKPTLDVTFPMMGIAYLLLVLFAAAEAWPPWPALVAAAGLVALSEALPGRLRYPAFAQAAVIGVTAGLVAPGWGAGNVAAGAAVASVVFIEVWARRPEPKVSLPLGAGLGPVALFLAWLAPWAMVVSGSILGLWGHIRRRTAPQQDGWEPESRQLIGGLATAAAMAAPALAAGALLRTLPSELAVLIAGAVSAVGAIAVRRLARDDIFYAFWIPAAAGAVTIASIVVAGAPADPAYGLLAGAAALAALAFAAAPRWPVVRIWLSAVTALWSVALALEAADVALQFRPPTIAVLGAVTVLASTAGRRRALGHLAIFGHLTTAAALAAAASGGPALVALVAFTAAWTVETVAGELGRSQLRRLLAHVMPPRGAMRLAVASIAPVFASISLPFLAADLATFANLVTTAQRGRMGLLLAGLALGYAAIARLTVTRRPLAPILTLGGFFLSGVAIAVAAPEPWPTITAIFSSIGVVAVVGGELRRPAMTWLAWAMSAILTILLADRFGVPSDWLHFVLLGWGTVGLIGGLAVDDMRSRRRDPGVGLRLDWVIRPVGLGALAIPVALSFGFDAPPVDAWPLAALAALVYGVAALQLRAGSTSVVFYGLAAYATGLRLADTSWDVTVHPWILSIFTLALVVVSFGVWLISRERRPWLRWDVAPLIVAHATALIAMALTAEAGSVPAVFLVHGGIALAISAWQRRWVWAVGGAGLLVFGAAAAGPGWLALTAGGLAILSGVAATISTGSRLPLQWASVAWSGWAFASATQWLEWWPDPGIAVTAAAAGAVAALVVLGVRLGLIARDWAAPAIALSLAGMGGALFGVLASNPDRSEAGIGLAVGFAGFALAAGLSARPFNLPQLREVAGVCGVLPGLSLIYGLDPSGGTVTAWAAALALGASVGSAALWRAVRSLWSQPGAVAGVLLFAGGLIAGADGAAHGWLAVLIGSLALSALAGAVVTEDATRWQLQALSAVATVGVWSQVIVWAGWWPAPAVAATIVGAALVGLLLAATARIDLLDRSWVLSFGVAAALTTLAGIALLPQVGRQPGGLAAAAGLLIWAVSVAIAARPLDLAPLREAAAVSLLGSGAALGYALEPTLNRQVATSLLAGLAATIFIAGLRLTRPGSAWIRPVVIYATVAQIGAILAALLALPETGLLSAALAAVGIEMLVLGGLLGLSAFLYTGPPLLLASWLLFATDAFRGNPQWYTIPLGITILALVDILRWDVKRRGESISAPVVAYADYAGMAFMVGASLIQVITRSTAHGLVAVLAGLLILAWSAATRLRRRAWGGAGAIVAASILMVAVPVAQIIPQFRGIVLWATIAAIGGVLIALASTLEQGKARAAETVQRIDDLMEGWE